MDLVGPTHVRSASGKWYVLVVVDDYSRYAWVFFLEDKGETFGFLRDLVLRLRNERHRVAIRAIRSDNGSEFRNSRFETLCHDLGLEHQFSSLYTPPQNGVVERKNRTLCEMARTMLDEHRTPRRFWAEAVNTACYVSKRIFLRVHKKKTCYELMPGRTPMVSHFHVFGFKCFILKKGKKLGKFEARSVDGIFFGYASHSRAYRVLNLETNQIVETCEVTFDETQPRSQLVFECASDDELDEEIFQEEEHELGDDEDGGVVPPAEHVPTTSTTVVVGVLDQQPTKGSTRSR
jgi:transposase InsO family protein